jgi:hypothetical protein
MLISEANGMDINSVCLLGSLTLTELWLLRPEGEAPVMESALVADGTRDRGRRLEKRQEQWIGLREAEVETMRN